MLNKIKCVDSKYQIVYNPFHSNYNLTLIQSGGGTGPMMPGNQPFIR